MNHEMTQFKSFAPDTSSFYDHIVTKYITGPFENPLLPRSLIVW